MSQVDLHIKVIEARDLPKMDTIGSVDAFVKISVGNEPIKKTKVVNNSYSPKWNETFVFHNIPQSTPVSFLVFDHDSVGSDDQISEFRMNTNALIVGKVADNWYNCKAVKGVKKGGEIRIMCHLCPHGATPFVETPMEQPQYPNPPMISQPQMYPPPPIQQQPMMPPPGMYPPQQQQQQLMMGQPGMYPPQSQPMMGQPQMYPPPQQQPMMGQPGMYPPQGQPIVAQPTYSQPEQVYAQPQATATVVLTEKEAKKIEKARKKEEKQIKKIEKKIEKKVDKITKKAMKALF